MEFKKKPSQSQLELIEIKNLSNKISELDPKHFFERFDELPLSSKTLKGLKENGYTTMTDIQKESLGHTLKGFDLLGAAKTGSGKTLAFIIPLIECLYTHRWSKYDGLGALIITPIRELAYQIYEVINKVGRYHEFSVALVIGGKDLHFERKRMSKCNIIICTPGRLLQHMDENPLFTCENLKIVVLDEADRTLDLGFRKTMNAIVENLPKSRQTLLFSATQTKSVKDLALLSLENPVYISVHEKCEKSTPDSLIQSYIVCELDEKLSLLWSFIKQHLKQKIIVFISTCKQTKFIFRLFCRMKPGIPLLALYGSLHQLRRMAIYKDFCSKKRAVFFATDIASRGLDFPEVHWVVQYDCPEDSKTYIHRVGRTARYKKGGESLLILLPSEEKKMIEELNKKKVPIKKNSIKQERMINIQVRARALLAKDPELKEDAIKAFKSYFKDVFLQKDKDIFDVTKLEKDSFASSFGLAITPRLRFLEKHCKSFRNSNIKSSKGLIFNDLAESDVDNEEILTIKNVIEPKLELNESEINKEEKFKNENKVITKVKAAKKLIHKNIRVNKKIVFDDDGNPIQDKPTEQKSEKLKLIANQSGIDVDLARQIMEDEDKLDKEFERKIIKEKHKERRLKLKNKARANYKQRKTDSEKEDNEDQSSGQLSDYIDELPDPDKYYGKDDSKIDEKTEWNSEDEDTFSENEEESDNSENFSDDKFQDQEEYGPRQKKFKSNLFKKNLDKLSLEQEEELALHLLTAN